MSWNITDALASSLPPGPQGPQGPQGPSGPNANAAYAQANSAYNTANLKLNIAGGTLTGTLNTQNLIPSANLNTPYSIDSFSSSTFRTVKYIVQATSISGIHSTEVFCMQDGVSAYLTEYATLISGSPLGNFSIGVASGNVSLTFSPINPSNNIITLKVIRYAVTS